MIFLAILKKDDKATSIVCNVYHSYYFRFKLFYPFYQKGSTAKYIAPFRVLRIFILVVSIVCVFVYTFARLRDVNFKPANELLKEENEIIQKYDERRKVLDNEVTAAKERINRFDSKSEELASRLATSRSARKRAEGRAVLSTLSKDQSFAYVNLFAQYEEQKNDLDSLKKIELDAFHQKSIKITTR
ncbi:MAG: hypothetical protein IPK76_14930 [Lewinellaceae bacterium]|nr:hypothetical protein [Lewinellaceae bacterium]